jgi:histidinol-phosphate aminotransferase
VTPRLRGALDAVPAYVAGRRPPEARSAVARLASNENPWGPAPAVRDAVLAAAADLNRYPDNSSGQLVERLAALHGVDRECIAVATGSVAILGQLAQVCVEPGDEVLFGWRSFEAYPIVTQVAGGRPIAVPLAGDLGFDLTRMVERCSARTRLVFICNPNNPTGTARGRDAIEGLCAELPDEVVVAVDEAYFEFADQSHVDCLPLARERENVCVLRTFSKAYGLAGVRVGYAVGSPPLVASLRKAAIPFGVSALAQAAALAALDAEPEMASWVRLVVAERRRLQRALRSMGFAVTDSAANFVWLPTGSQSGQFADYCEERGVLVRAYAADGTRVTIADPASNDRFLTVASEWRQAHQPDDVFA